MPLPDDYEEKKQEAEIMLEELGKFNMRSDAYIYVLECHNPESDREVYYVGQTKHILNRLTGHLMDGGDFVSPVRFMGQIVGTSLEKPDYNITLYSLDCYNKKNEESDQIFNERLKWEERFKSHEVAVEEETKYVLGGF